MSAWTLEELNQGVGDCSSTTRSGVTQEEAELLPSERLPHEQPLHRKSPLHTEVMVKQLIERYHLSVSVSAETPQTGITSS